MLGWKVVVPVVKQVTQSFYQQCASGLGCDVAEQAEDCGSVEWWIPVPDSVGECPSCRGGVWWADQEAAPLCGVVPAIGAEELVEGAGEARALTRAVSDFTDVNPVQ